MDEIMILQIAWGSKEYREELELRNKLLRVPLGMSLFTEDLSGEEKDIHIGAFIQHQLVGVMVLTRLDGACVKMRQVAVREKYQGQGIGGRLVAYAEELAKSKGYREIQLHARKTAAGFYTRWGYTITGEEFTEVGIPHLAMKKDL